MSSLLADAQVRTFYAWNPLLRLDEWWHFLVLALILSAALVFIVFMYVLDSVELRSGTTALLVVLRVVAVVGLLVFFLNPERRSEKRIVKNSRVAVLVDTSLSMGLRDADSSSVPATPSRIEQVAVELSQGEFITQLRTQHDVVAYRFDQESKPTEIASFPRIKQEYSKEEASELALSRKLEELEFSRLIAVVAGGAIVGSVLMGLLYVLFRFTNAPTMASWATFFNMLLLVAAAAILATANLHSSDFSLRSIVGLADDETILAEATSSADSRAADDDAEQATVTDVDWPTALSPRGGETRLGEALRYVINKERGGPIAGIVLFSDGRGNAGIEPSVAIATARDAKIPIYTIGMGSTIRPINVRVVDIEVPQRVFPGDNFLLKGLLQSYGLKGESVKVQLVSTREDDAAQAEEFEGERTVQLGADGKELSVEFELTPEGQGRRVYALRVEPPARDRDTRDNQKTAVVEVVQRKNKVLLMAGGPTRDFLFLRDQLYRDHETELFTYLQSAGPGMAQNKDETLLFEFPATSDELFEFDCIVAFDPDWRTLTKTALDLLDRWVAEKAGGLIVTAGPVFTPEWTRRPRGDAEMDIIRALYPVSFFSQGSATTRLGRVTGDQAWPLEFTREGRSAEFLWLEDSPGKSETAWSDFAGVYGYYLVNEAKPGANVFARFSDPSTAGGSAEELPIYLAGQFYGAGRVYFQASGEMWRLRALNAAYFERYYTKLIRWASQGRLLRDSTRGVLLVDKDRCILGDAVEVRAILNDAQQRPLMDAEVTAALVQPDSTQTTLTLKRVDDGARQGTFVGQFTALQEGDYRIVVAVPDSEKNELLTRELRVRVPDLEVENPERNDALLSEIAEKTKGVYVVGVDELARRENTDEALPKLIVPQDQETYLPGAPDRRFVRVLMAWLIGLICGVLCLEWLVRRLNKLA